MILPEAKPHGALTLLRPLHAIIGRELKRLVRQRGRLLSAMVRPMIWMLIIGGGLGAVFQELGQEGYQRFLVPGLLCMVLLFGCMLAALSMVYDKESGVMRMLIIAPFPNFWILLARTLSAALVGLVHAVLLILLLTACGFMPWPQSFILLVAGLLSTALLCASCGILIAVFSRTLENFAVLMNFLIFPVFFLSGALYPIQHLPVALKLLTFINPFSYGVDLMKHALLPLDTPPAFMADFTPGLDLGVQLGATGAALLIACLRFSQSNLRERLARRLGSGRTP